MLKESILKQKYEKEKFLSENYIERKEMTSAKRWMDTDLIKVIAGPRRAGKSVFAFMLLKNKPFMYFNFDDEIALSDSGLNTGDLMKELYAVYGETKTIFFDEIQNLPKWELFVNRLHREGYNLIITGSNSKLLSKELSSSLTGRHIPIEIMPFTFEEFLLGKKYSYLANPTNSNLLPIPQNKGKLLNLFSEYLNNGGFPEVVVKNFEAEGYLDTLFDAILFKDIVRRYNVRFSSQIANLSLYLVNNFANPYSLRKLKNILNLRSVTTIEKYMEYFEEAYLMFGIRRLSYKASDRIKSPKKIYVIDNGYIKAKATQFSENRGRLLENLVFTELMKTGLKPNINIFYYKTRNGKEVDFAIKKGFKVSELIQVSYETSDEKTVKREIKALIEASEELNCNSLKILTYDEEKEIKKGGKVIQFIPIWKWLLNK